MLLHSNYIYIVGPSFTKNIFTLTLDHPVIKNIPLTFKSINIEFLIVIDRGEVNSIKHLVNLFLTVNCSLMLCLQPSLSSE